MRWKHLYISGWLAIAVAVGCSKETLQQLPSMDEAKKAVVSATQSATETVKQTAGMAGKIDGNFGGPFTAQGCYGGWLISGNDLPSVLMITSYHEPDSEKFPSVMIRCVSEQTRLGEMAGKATLVDRIFVQETEKSAVWELPAEQTGTVNLQTASDLEFAGEVTADLVNTESGEMRKFTGKFGGEVRP
jgi:hypothetical protein